jgi:hypothetical protein
MPRYFFFGLVRVPMYEYYWGHTAAQIQLIDIDQPITLYKMSDPNEGLKPGDKGWKPNAKKLEKTVEDWKKRKAEREKRGFKLDTFLRTGEKVPVDNDTTQTK